MPTAAELPTRGGWRLGGALLLGWLVLWNRLRIDWSVNDQYAYGWFVPFLALALLGLRWRDRPDPVQPDHRVSAVLAGAAVLCLLGLLPTRLIEEPNGDWRLLSWVHAGLLTVLSLIAAAWCGGKPWARHFAFPVGFLLLALPWPSGPEQALVQGLQHGVASLAAEGMNLLGIPAQQQGNLIRVREQLVGVNEACSGIRSLQTVLMAGLFLGELSRLPLPRRLALLGGGLAVAMVANVFRSALLVYLAAQGGPGLLARYHDLAGVSVLVIVFVGLLFLNGRLEKKNPAVPAPADGPTAPLTGGAAARWMGGGFLVAAVAWLVVVEAGTEAWYRVHEGSQSPRRTWTVAWPEDAPGYHSLPVDEVSRGLLRYDHGGQGRWHSPGPPAGDCSVNFFRWEPGRTSTTLAVMHQPTACLPASGLRQVSEEGVRPMPAPGGFVLPVRSYEFRLREQPVHVYYVVWQDRVGYELPTVEQAAAEGRLAAVRRGQRNLGQQTLELVVTGVAGKAAADAICERTLAQIIRAKG